jgi:threonine dehydratase
VTDRPGGIARLSAAVAEAGASIQEIRHERAFSRADIFSTTVEVTVETAEAGHIAALRQRLEGEGFTLSAT